MLIRTTLLLACLALPALSRPHSLPRSVVGGASPVQLVSTAMSIAQAAPGPVSLIVRSTSPDAVLTVNIVSDRPGYALAVFNGAPGWVTSNGITGAGTTPTIVTLDPKPGWVRMFVADNEPPIRVAAFNDTTLKDLVAEGRVILAVRDSLGHIKLTRIK